MKEQDMATYGDSQVPSLGTDHRGSTVLSFDECLRRLREVPVGRLGLRSGGDIVMLPVNHFVSGTTVSFRTDWGSKLEALPNGAPVSFEADDFDEASRTGWSVLVKGVVEWIEDGTESEALDRTAPVSWLPATADAVWVRIWPEEVTGRELTPPSRAVTPPLR
jgi:nitroimidazol reductase NimA-like FMN-containing flavoprotein (pyridoxamine 5'-phosphate oxidase superfamily)